MMEHFIDYFLQQISESTEFGQTTNELVGEIPYTVGQFWTSRQRQGHSIQLSWLLQIRITRIFH